MGTAFLRDIGGCRYPRFYRRIGCLSRYCPFPVLRVCRDLPGFIDPGTHDLSGVAALGPRHSGMVRQPQTRNHSAEGTTKTLRHFLDLDLVGIEGEVAGDFGHGGKWIFVSPDRIRNGLAVGDDAEIIGGSLVGTM